MRNLRLMWNCEGNITQTAYQIVSDNWDSGKVVSASMQAVYPNPLKSRERVRWKIRLWDEQGEAGAWSEGSFEMGLLEESDWKAKWITGNYRVNRRKRYPVDCFKKLLLVRKEIDHARLYITACGLYEACLDGVKIGDFCLAPGLTDYRKRVQYQTYDVTEMLTAGSHTLSVQLADGWYRGSCGAWGAKNQYGTETKLLAQLEIAYADGAEEIIVTDKSWQWSNDGPIRFADNKDGEIVEAFRVATYTGRAKQTHHSVIPSASNNVSVREHEHFHPIITKSPNGKLLLDFGQNIAGYISFRVRGSVGQRLIWRFGEMLDEDGNLTQKNIQCSNNHITTPLQKIEYTCGVGWNVYKTSFAVFGFQYAEVDTDAELLPENVEAIAVYSDMKQTGSFTSSNTLLNRFVQATIWSAKGNSLDIPTDCPTRERHGWTGDAQIFFETAAYLFDYAAFSEKYLRDVYDWQKRDGRLPQIAPYGGVDFYMWTLNGSVGWSDVGILLPYRFWKLYGDRKILNAYYDRMKLYAEFMIRRISCDGVVRRGQSYGEWAEPADVCPYDWKDTIFPHQEVSTAYTAFVLGVMAEISQELCYPEDASLFRENAVRCAAAYQRKFAKALDTDRQAHLVRPLAFGLLDAKHKRYAEARLLRALEHYDWKLGTGFLSTPLILDVLSEFDLEAAYRLLENEQTPGWLSMPKAGATTIWEAWEGPNAAHGGIASLNHYSKGAVCAWLFKTMCGIRVDGERHFTIAPQPGGQFRYAQASYQSVYGLVVSGWKRGSDDTVFNVAIPSNCTADLLLPDGTRATLQCGAYTFRVRG